MFSLLRWPDLVLLYPLVISPAFATFNAGADTNVAVYWGQGPNQERLADFCADSNIDILIISFINIFPDQGAGGYPGSNFGNACGGEVYINDGIPTQLLADCPTIGPDIVTCQQTYGKKVLLSIGGAAPGNGYLVNDTSAVAFANFLWGSFGPATTKWTSAGGPRPFGSAVVDGFDFDIESTAMTATQEYFGWSALVDQLHDVLYPMDSSKKYYISGAPQCVLPDAHLSDAIQKSWFDFIFVQFYNTPYCSARAGVDKLEGIQESDWDISLHQWFQAPSKNPHSKIYIGLPASTSAAGSPDQYLTPTEVGMLIKAYQPHHLDRFGGVMLWEATHSLENQINGAPYADGIKSVLLSDVKPLSPTTTRESAATSSTRRTASVQTHKTTKTKTTLVVTTTRTRTRTVTSTTERGSHPTSSNNAATTSTSSTSAKSSATGSSSICSAPYVPCSQPNTLICVDSTHFGICNLDYCAFPQAVAPGTTCSNNAISKRDVNASEEFRTADEPGENASDLDAMIPFDVGMAERLSLSLAATGARRATPQLKHHPRHAHGHANAHAR